MTDSAAHHPPRAASVLHRLFGRPRERRRDRRVDGSGAWLVCRGHRLPLADLSLGGLRVRQAPASLVSVGERIDFSLELPMAVRPLLVQGEGEVVRVAPGEFALRYVSADHRLMRVLHYFLGSRPPQDGRRHRS
ncbi:PilZ domain-containing protein [Azospirillum sp. ST 5-10]|uniref:PilZ domain-containing protein n=1 Tax=unclassified Azospirillum TaxID=2630922 RepID=UPI003F49B7BB